MKKTKKDMITAIRVYKNRLEIYGNMIYDDLYAFDDKFSFVMNRFHMGEVNALKDMFLTYLAYAYKMGVHVGKTGKDGIVDEVLKGIGEKNGLQSEDNNSTQVGKD